MRRVILVFCLIPFLIPSAARAAEPGAGDNLETVVVSATRSEQRRDLTGSSVSVISASDLEVEHLRAITDALRETPALTVVQNGGPGQPATIGLRGAAAGQTLFVIDGVRINDPTSTDTEALLGDLLVNNIERIEVLRGPQSTLYGSDAIGGVVDIFTRRGGATSLSGFSTFEGGSFGTFRLNASGFGTAGGIEYGGGVNLYTTEGVAAADTRRADLNPDGYRNLGATANARIPVTAEISVDARAWYVDARTVFDTFPPPNFTLQYTGEYGLDRLLALYGGVNFALFSDRLRNRIAVTRLISDRKNFNPGQSVSEDFYARGGSENFEYQGVFDVSPADQIVFGAESLRTNMRTGSPTTFDPNPPPLTGHSRTNSYYAQYQTTMFGDLTLTGGYRHEDDAEFGGHDSVKATAAWSLFSDATILRGNYGDGFKAPSLYEQFSPFSNPVQALAPETARGWEAGADEKLLGGRAVLSVVWFHRETRDQIDFFDCFGVMSAACTERPFGYYANIVRSRSEGLELEASAQLFDTIHFYGNLTNMSAVDATSGQDLARRPRLMGNARIVWAPDGAWSVGASASFTGRRFDDRMQEVRLAPFTVMSLFASYALNGRVQLYGRAENLLDQHYETAAGYRSVPRTFSAGMRMNL